MNSDTPAPALRVEPCPFCGKQPSSRYFGDEDGGYWGIDCSQHAQAHEDTEAEAIAAWNTRAFEQSPPVSTEAGLREEIKAELAELITRYYRARIGQTMAQAEHWMENGKPLAVHHRVSSADEMFQTVVLFDPDRRKLGWDCPFKIMEDWLKLAEKWKQGQYPPSRELHKYRDPRFVVEALPQTQPEPLPCNFCGAPYMEAHAADCAGFGAKAHGEPVDDVERYGAKRFTLAAPGDRQSERWILRFDDNDCRDQHFDNEADAWAAWNQFAPSWNCYLFRLATLRPLDPAEGDVEGLPDRLYKLADDIVAGETIYSDHVHGGLIEAADAIIEYRKNLVAALAALPRHADRGWQDISTAPKDGTEIYACYDPEFDPVADIIQWEDGNWWTDGDYWQREQNRDYKPRHNHWAYWTHLPSLPALRQLAGERG